MQLILGVSHTPSIYQRNLHTTSTDNIGLAALSTAPTGGVVAFGWYSRRPYSEEKERERTAAWTDHFFLQAALTWLLAPGRAILRSSAYRYDTLISCQ